MSDAKFNTASQYRPDIDGLRAVAVTSVVLFHAFPEAIPSGFIGVDIFFVISGFLITGIIASELKQERFGLLAFYGRRVRRIFPALIVVLAALLIAGWFWMLPAAYMQLSSDVFASTAFAANIALLLQSGYFDVEAAKKPLLHLWSLGIEEQFYLAWPLILVLAARLRQNLLAVAAVIALASFALNVAMIGPQPIATFYLPFTRAWELLAGAVLACGWSHISQTAVASNLRALAGAVLIAVAALLLDTTSAFPGWWAALPVAGSALLLSAPNSWVARHVLARKGLVKVGLISYPLYLWHWPLLVFFAMMKFKPLTVLERGLIVGLSLLLAWTTFSLVERPIRSGRLVVFKVGGLIAAMVLIAVVGEGIVVGRGFEFRLPEPIRAMATVLPEVSKWRLHQCLLDSGHETSFASSCVDRGQRPLIMVWGDSTAAALMPGLRRAEETHNFRLAQFTTSSCIPALNADIPSVPNCRAINDRVISIARQLQPDIVLLHGTWGMQMDHVAETIAVLRRDTKARVVVLGSVPGWPRGLPAEVQFYYMLHKSLIPARWSGPEPWSGVTTNRFDAVMREKLEPAGAKFISAWDIMCDQAGCLTRIGDSAADITTSDQVHLTEKGSVFVVDAILGRLLSELGG